MVLQADVALERLVLDFCKGCLVHIDYFFIVDGYANVRASQTISALFHSPRGLDGLTRGATYAIKGSGGMHVGGLAVIVE